MVGGYKTGPREIAKLSNSEREELIQLRKQNKILQEGKVLPDREEGVWNPGRERVKRIQEVVSGETYPSSECPQCQETSR